MTQRDKARKFGPVEVLVAVFVCIFVVALIWPASRMLRLDPNRVTCARNLFSMISANIKLPFVQWPCEAQLKMSANAHPDIKSLL